MNEFYFVIIARVAYYLFSTGMYILSNRLVCRVSEHLTKPHICIFLQIELVLTLLSIFRLILPTGIFNGLVLILKIIGQSGINKFTGLNVICH